MGRKCEVNVDRVIKGRVGRYVEAARVRYRRRGHTPGVSQKFRRNGKRNIKRVEGARSRR